MKISIKQRDFLSNSGFKEFLQRYTHLFCHLFLFVTPIDQKDWTLMPGKGDPSGYLQPRRDHNPFAGPAKIEANCRKIFLTAGQYRR
jgi:hypothetical protein